MDNQEQILSLLQKKSGFFKEQLNKEKGRLQKEVKTVEVR